MAVGCVGHVHRPGEHLLRSRRRGRRPEARRTIIDHRRHDQHVRGLLLVVLALAGVVNVGQRAAIKEDGLPTGVPGLEPRLACVVPVAGPYSYVGQPVEPDSGPVVYFGRADGRLAVWSARSGGVLLDGQAVGLRFVQPGSTCT